MNLRRAVDFVLCCIFMGGFVGAAFYDEKLVSFRVACGLSVVVSGALFYLFQNRR